MSGRDQAAEPKWERAAWDTFLPDDWFGDRENSSFWLSAFRIARVVAREDHPGYRTVDLYRVRAVVVYGQIGYLDPGRFTLHLPELESEPPKELEFASEGAGYRETPKGVWLILLTPYDVDGRSGNEVEVRQRIESAAGLFAMFNGYNMVFEPGPENIFSLGTGQPTVASPALINPYAFARPDVSESHLARIGLAGQRIGALPLAGRNRANLALHWFHLAMRDHGADAFLKRWIALEVLGMPDGTNIRPVNEALSAAYGITYGAARDTFRIGRLADVRARIVHGGEPLPIHHALDLYFDAIFYDVFLQLLGEPCDRRAAGILEQAGAEFWSRVIPPLSTTE